MSKTTVGAPQNVEAAEVPPELLAQLETLIKALNENKRLYSECKDIDVSGGLRALEEKAGRVAELVNEQKSALKGERMRTAGMTQKVELDQRIAHNIQRNRENMAKNPQYGRIHAVDFLHDVVTQNEQSLVEQCETVQKLAQILEKLQKADGEPSLSQHELVEHINRFDKIFEQVAQQVYAANEGSEKLRDIYTDQRRKFSGGAFVGGLFDDPFEKRKERLRMVDAYSTLKGIDAFPSPNAMLSLSEYLSKQPSAPAHQPQFGATQFGSQPAAGGSMFGVAAKPMFSFTPSSAAASQPGGGLSLFGTPAKPTFGAAATATAPATNPFGAATATSAAANTSIPLFGGGTSVSASSQPAVQPVFGFSNTLSSASSGTLFKGSAPAKPNSLFGPK